MMMKVNPKRTKMMSKYIYIYEMKNYSEKGWKSKCYDNWFLQCTKCLKHVNTSFVRYEAYYTNVRIIFNFSFNDKREEIIDMHMIFEFIARDMVKIYARKFLK